MGFYDTYDPNQGGESNRLLFTLHTASGAEEARFHQAMFLGHRTMRMRSNFTGWMTDTLATSGEVPGVSEQRGDGAESRYGVLTAGFAGTLHPVEADARTRATPDDGLRHSVRPRQFKPASNPGGYGDPLQHRLRSQLHGGQPLGLDPSACAALEELRFAWRGVRFDAFSFGVTDLNQEQGGSRRTQASGPDEPVLRVRDQSARHGRRHVGQRPALSDQLWSGYPVH